MPRDLRQNTQTTEIEIEEINELSPHLPTVIELGDAHKDTLGFLPHSVFVDKAKAGNIFVALDSQGICVGYVLYRYAKRYNRHSLVHLCVAPSHRGQGIAKRLVDYLKEITQESNGIGLHCRRDFNLDKMWRRLGFVSQYDKTGKSKDGKLLTYWWFDHGHENLFSITPTEKLESRLCPVIDTQIFFELATDTNSSFAESKSLFADWVLPQVQLCVTDEIFNKINLIEEAQERNRLRDFVKQKFTLLPSSQDNFDYLLYKITNLLKANKVIIEEL